MPLAPNLGRHRVREGLVWRRLRGAAGSLTASIRYVVITTLLTLAMAEVTARALTQTAPNGLIKFRNLALLPLRPDEALVRRALDIFSRDHLLMADPYLGWNVRPNKTTDGDHTNAEGIRAEPTRRYETDPPRGKVRIATFGDSYVYCMQVSNGETWQDYLEQIRGDVELVNFGLPGGGTDQAYLRWVRDGRRLNPHIVIVGIWPDNIFRNLSVVEYYRTQLSLPLTKPRLIIDEDGSSRFVNQPTMGADELVSTLARPEGSAVLRYEFWYDPVETELSAQRRLRLVQFGQSIWHRYQRKRVYRKLLSGELPDGLEVTVRVVELFARDVRASGAIPVVLMIPDRGRLDLHVGRSPFPLVAQLRAHGIDVIDLGPSFGEDVRRDGSEPYYVDGDGHHSPFGNRVFAQYLERELRPHIEEAKKASGRF